MIGHFFESFGKEEEQKGELPDTVLEALNRQLPSSFMYKRNDNGNYVAVQKPEKDGEQLKIRCNFLIDKEKDRHFFNRMQQIPKEKVIEYCYRIQKPIPVKKAVIEDEYGDFPLEILSADPLSDDDINVVDSRIYPPAFDSPKEVEFESPEGEIVTIPISQQPYDSITEVLFKNVDFPALNIEIYLYSPLAKEADEDSYTREDSQLVMKFSVKPRRAETTTDAVIALHIVRGLCNGTTKVNGKTVSPSSSSTDNPAQLEDGISLWETLLKIEKQLQLHFDPSVELSTDDLRTINELKVSLIDKKRIIWRHPFDHFTATGIRFESEEMNQETLFEDKPLFCEYLEGPIAFSLLGAEFELYSQTRMENFYVTNIEWEDEKKNTGEVFISDSAEKPWTLSRLFITADEIKKGTECDDSNHILMEK